MSYVEPIAAIPNLDAIAREIAGLCGVADRLVADHQPDRWGRCRACRSQHGGSTWPCSLYRIATRARALPNLSAERVD